MSRKEYAYKQVVEILMNKDFSAEELIKKMLKEDPEKFLEFYDGRKIDNTKDVACEPDHVWYKEYFNAMVEGRLVDAIRMLRNRQNIGLKEAKDLTTSIRECLYKKYYRKININDSADSNDVKFRDIDVKIFSQLYLFGDSYLRSL